MKKIALLICAAVLFASCGNDDDTTQAPEDTSVDFRFTQNWDGEEINNADYETTIYVNANGEEMTLSKVNYLISDITFTAISDGTVYQAEDYNLVLAREGENINFTPNIEIPEGDYNVSFTFGFDDEDNDREGGYLDLNSADGTWNVPAPLGGGYHYQRIEGTYINAASETTNFQFHTVRANKHETLPPGPGTLIELTDTSFIVELGAVSIEENTEIEVKADIAQWFTSPLNWDLNQHFQVLMPKYERQIEMRDNGSTANASIGVFSLGTVTQE